MRAWMDAEEAGDAAAKAAAMTDVLRTGALRDDALREAQDAYDFARRRGCPGCPAWVEAERALDEGDEYVRRLPDPRADADANLVFGYLGWHYQAVRRVIESCWPS